MEKIITYEALLSENANLRAQLADAIHAKPQNEQLDAANDLLISREHFKFLADNIPVMVWTARSNGEIDYFNKRWYEYTGSTFNECKGWGWKNLVHPEDQEEFLAAWNDSIKHKTPFKFEYRLRRKDGEYLWHFRHALPFTNEMDKSLAWFGISTDIHERRKAMEKKDEFISVVSHELKTPLTSVKAYIQLIQGYKNEPLPSTVNQYINKAEEYVRKLEHLIRDLMDVSKIQAGKLEFTLSEMSLVPLLNACTENVQLLYPEISFELSSHQDLKVMGNYERLEQVLMNLINNAVKYSPDSKKVIIGLHRSGDNARVTVTDFGIGLTPDQQEMIFERFYRVNNVKHFFPGLGMGLYISSEIVKAHNGTMGVISRSSEGSTFYFDLPAL